jgi:PemK-like, MazF-like toxin of type II toxin-antitoxin system
VPACAALTAPALIAAIWGFLHKSTKTGLSDFRGSPSIGKGELRSSAVTSQFELSLYPTEVLVKTPEAGLTVDSVILLNQIRSIDRRWLVRRLGMVRPATMTNVERALMLSLGLVRI